MLTGLHNEINIFSLPVGHTKFSPDCCFGLKQQYKKITINCLDDIVRVANRSATPNVAQLVGTQSGGANTIPLTPEMIELYERRVENGYDILTDLNYVAWLEKFHPEHLAPLGMSLTF